MEIRDRKLEIIRWLINVEDESILKQIEFLRKSNKEKIDSLSEEEIEAIKEGLKELDEGKGIPHEEVMRDLKKKYSP